jgi:hypothetical protein
LKTRAETQQQLKTIAIMQPTYLPWLGYFNLMDQSDDFVLLDSVQFDRRSWQQRNRLKSPQGEYTLTVPVQSKGLRDQKIRDVRIDPSSQFAIKHMRSLELHYAKAPYFGEYCDDIFQILKKDHEFLSELTIELIGWTAKTLGIKARIFQSSDYDFQEKKGELLYALCRHFEAGIYLSPEGSKNYLDDCKDFKQGFISIRYHQYQHPVYPQQWGNFLPQLSTLDLLFNAGERSLEILRSGSR